MSALINQVCTSEFLLHTLLWKPKSGRDKTNEEYKPPSEVGNQEVDSARLLADNQFVDTFAAFAVAENLYVGGKTLSAGFRPRLAVVKQELRRKCRKNSLHLTPYVCKNHKNYLFRILEELARGRCIQAYPGAMSYRVGGAPTWGFIQAYF